MTAERRGKKTLGVELRKTSAKSYLEIEPPVLYTRLLRIASHLVDNYDRSSSYFFTYKGSRGKTEIRVYGFLAVDQDEPDSLPKILIGRLTKFGRYCCVTEPQILLEVFGQTGDIESVFSLVDIRRDQDFFEFESSSSKNHALRPWDMESLGQFLRGLDERYWRELSLGIISSKDALRILNRWFGKNFDFDFFDGESSELPELRKLQ